MSDLLSRMIDRASGAASPVEPVLGSRYEPQTPFAPASVLAEQATAPQTEELERPAPTTHSILRRPRLGSLQDEAEQPKPAPQLYRPEPEPPPQTNRPVPAQIDAALPRERLVVRGSSPSTRAESREIRIEATERTSTNWRSETRIAEKTQPVVRAPSPTTQNEAIPLEAPRPTDIEISIGHVELRMVAPARPAVHLQPRTRPAHPRLSLDDYLRRRNGGAR